jgi:microcin C transport system substrate-binding protein
MRRRSMRGLTALAFLLAAAAPAASQTAPAAAPEAPTTTQEPAATQEWRSVSSLIGESKYGDDFRYYDYVNPDAPQGGTLNMVATGTFDSFNPFIVRGTPAAGLTSFGGILYDTLMQQSPDEPGTSHALIAEAFTYPDDYSSATYRLNPEARWHDGMPITAEDVVWSFNTLKELNPLYNKYYANVTEAEALSDHEVKFTFDQTGNRELPHIMGDLTVLPKHWWEGTDAQGNKRNIANPTLEPPLGSGPYKIASFRPGSEIVWERVEDYWAEDLPTNVGRHNFDRRRYTYFTDENAAWQAFTKGGISDVRFENRAQKWATEYNFPAFEAGDVIKREFESESGEPMQGFIMNTRRPQFQDPRVRQALNYAFDFDSMNRTLFYGLYERTDSYFEGSELASRGLPEGQELTILKSVEDGVPPEVFTEEYTLPSYDTPQAQRDNLRRAFQLFQEAGWVNRNGRLVNGETGEPFTIEFLGDSPSDERITLPFVDNLRRLGIDATIRIVDPTQYINRMNEFDFDMATVVLAQSQSPGNEQRDFWGSAAADAEGSRNYAGIKNEAIDALIEKVIFAEDREELVAATRALDRVLLWNYYIVPQWHNPTVWVAYWDKFGIPDKQPAYAGVDIESWWIRPEQETAIEAKYDDETE